MNIDNTLYQGRPSDTRIPKEERCYDLLDSLALEYWRVDHDHADTIWRIMCGCQTMHEAEDVGGRYWREYLEDIINTPQRIAARAAHVARHG